MYVFEEGLLNSVKEQYFFNKTGKKIMKNYMFLF